MKEETLYFTQESKRLKELYVKPGQKVAANDRMRSDVEDMTKQLRDQRLHSAKKKQR